jgi:hypothetical protein
MSNATLINDMLPAIPDEFRTKTLYVLGQLQSASPQVRDDAIRNAHHLAAHLKQIADGHLSPSLMMDTCRPMCARVADHIYAHIDVARSKDDNAWNQGA